MKTHNDHNDQPAPPQTVAKPRHLKPWPFMVQQNQSVIPGIEVIDLEPTLALQILNGERDRVTTCGGLL